MTIFVVASCELDFHVSPVSAVVLACIGVDYQRLLQVPAIPA